VADGFVSHIPDILTHILCDF